MSLQDGIFGKHSFLLAGLVLLLFGVVLYSNTLKAPFVFDDKPNITENACIRMTAVTPAQIARIPQGPSALRPVAMFTFALNYYFHQYRLPGYHTVNILIHFLTALLVFLVARKTFGLARIRVAWPTPLLAALLWLVHPLHTQSVTYIVQRMNTLAALFCLLALFCYIIARQRLRARKRHARLKASLLFLMVIISGLLGLAAKPTAGILPLVLFLYEWLFFQNFTRDWRKKNTRYLFISILAFVAIAAVFLGPNPFEAVCADYESQNFTMVQRLLTEPLVVIYYLSLLIFPHPARLNLDHDFPLSQGVFTPPETALCLVALLALPAAAVYAARKHPLASFAIFWFLTTLLIESSVIGRDIIFEHRTYLPSIFPVVALAWMALHYLRPRIIAWGILFTAICLCGFGTCQRNTIWQNEIRLWQDCTNKAPQKARPYNNLGAAYIDHGNPEKALPYLRCAIELDPEYHQAYLGMGRAMLELGHYQQALAYCRKSLAVGPATPQTYVNMGAALQKLGKTEKAIECYEQALHLQPYRLAYNNLGKAYFEKGDLETSRQYFRKAIQLSPTYTVARENLARLQSIITKNQEEIRAIKQHLQAQPFHLGLLDQLSNLYAAAGQYARAAATYEIIATIAPDNGTVFYNLACLYARQNKTGKALLNLEKAIDKGYRKWSHLKNDKDLDNIRHIERFQNIIKGNPKAE